MSRTPKAKTLVNTCLTSGYGGWIYCDSCGENIGYLCYVTYNDFLFSYQCKCGGHGSMHLAFETDISAEKSDHALLTIKSRLCCSNDNSPLFTILYKKLESYRYEVVCTKCSAKYMEEKVL